MKSELSIFLLLISLQSFSQKNTTDSIARDLNRLIYAKIDYEKFKSFAESNPSRHSDTRDSSYKKYINQVNKIKRHPKVYLTYINAAIRKPELAEELMFYNHINTTMPFDPNEYLISKQDFYRVIKHSLLLNNNNALPEHLDDIKIIIKRDHRKPFKLQTQEDIRKSRIQRH